MSILYLILAILMFGLLIAVHEFGHFITAKLTGVKVNEFAIGMGPALLKKQKGETLYSLRLFPAGGYCAMEGEDEETGDDRAFTVQPGWKKVLILVAGAFMNFVVGLLLLLIVYAQAGGFVSPVIAGFMDGFPLESEQGLMVGDRFLEIDGEPIYLSSNVSFFLSRGNGRTADVVVERNGQRVELDNLALTLRTYVVNGQETQKYGLYFVTEEGTLGNKLKYTCLQAIDDVRMVWYSLRELFRGAVGLKDLSGPVGIISMVGEVGEQGAQAAQAQGGSAFYGALMNIFNFASFIAINLAVMNLLPIPALDGGRVFFVLINSIVMLIAHRRIDPKYEGYIHAAGFILLIGLMIIIALSDVWKLIS